MRIVPFPRPFLKTYATAGIIMGLSIAFILMVFQPFGTDKFVHEYKVLILSGYGIIATCSIIIYYALSLNFFNKGRERNWTIIHESIDLFVSLIIGLLMCYFYFAYIFDYSITLSGMYDFLIRAGSVTVLPVFGLFLYLLSEYRDVVRSTMQIEDKTKNSDIGKSIVLKGTNKEDVIRTSEDQLLFIKAEDNYVILHFAEDGSNTKRHMIRSTMKQILNQLNEHHFVQCHRSFIINQSRLLSLSGNKNQTKAQIAGSSRKIPVARSKVDQLRNHLQSTLGVD